MTGRPETAGRPGVVRWAGSARRPAPGDRVGRAPPPGCRRAGAGWGSAGVRRSESGEPTCVPGRRPCGAAERSGPAGSRLQPPPAGRPGRFPSRALEHPASPRTPTPRPETRGWRPPARDAPATPTDQAGRRPRRRPRAPVPSPGTVGRRRRPRPHAAPLPWHRPGRSRRGRVPRAPGRRRRPAGWALAGRPGQASRGARSAVRRWAGPAGSAAWVGPGGQVGLPGGIGPPGAAKPTEMASMPASAIRHRRSTHPGMPTGRRRRAWLVARKTRARESSASARMPLAGLPGSRARPMASGIRPASPMGPMPPAESMEGRSRLRPAMAEVRRLAGVAWTGGWVCRPGRAAGWLERMEAVRGSGGGLPPLPGPIGPGPATLAKPGCPVGSAGWPRAGPGPVRRPGWMASGPREVGPRARWPACGCRGGR